MKICKVEWCEEKHRENGYCSRHAWQYRNWGEIRRSRGDKNEFILKDDHAEIILYDINYKEKARAIVDLDDVERCKTYKWSLRTDGYVSTKIMNKGLKLHRFIMNTPKGKHTDHKDRDRLNNRKSNLEICTQSKNNKNKGSYSNNKTGKSGVSVNGNKYQADIKYEGVSHYLGLFDNLNDAIKAREMAELKFYGFLLKD
ncbi:HNH endonuclease [Priestia aryabhattai]|uniref:HNH endonuclease n=1 Tax=Priestia aryabhattai TaxID=412384 RepID=UPI0015F6C46D|nr:HNH endonuclease [Priestia aryabhattai]